MLTSDALAHIKTRVASYRAHYSLPRLGQAFMLWYGFLDLFHVDDDSERLIVAQGKYHEKGAHKAQEGDLLKLLHTTDWLRNPEALVREGRPDIAEAAREYNEAIAKGYSVEYVFAYMGPPKKEVQDAASNFNNSEAGNAPARFARVVHDGVLQQVYEDSTSAATRIAQETIRLDPARAFEQQATYGRALIANVPGDELRRLYNAHTDRLFERNVRLYLGARKGSVNAGIRQTLATASERSNFWAYNNGLTFICDAYDYDPSTGSLTLRNFSIVNGCRTTVSVAESQDGAASDVEILARFISVLDEPIVDSIITYTNSQTPIRQWDIASQDKVQRRLKVELEKDPHPFLYELRKVASARMARETKDRLTRNGKLQVIRPDQLAQYLGAFDGLPVTAYKEKGQLFRTLKETIFPRDLRVEKVILAWLSAEVADEAVREALRDAAKRGDKEKERIFRRGGKIFVLAVMALLLAERNGAAALERMKREVAGSNETRRRLKRYAAVAVLWYVQAVKDVLDSGADLTVLLRSPEQYPRIRDKVLTTWNTYRLSEKWLDDALPSSARYPRRPRHDTGAYLLT